MRLQRFTPGPRRGFTLVEVMVAAGLCVLILTVMTYAFRNGMDTFSHLKSTGELQERLRSAELALRSDLTADHFDAESGGKLSNVRLDRWDPAVTNSRPAVPRNGYFRIVNRSAATNEGVMDGIQSTRATDHVLAFTVKRSGLRDTEAFTASVPSAAVATALSGSGLPNLLPASATTTFASEWSEVAYFLANPVGMTGQTTPGGLPMFTLYRRARVVLNAPEATPTNWQTAVGGAANLPLYDGLSYNAVTYLLNDVLRITDPANRFGGRTGGLMAGSLTPRESSAGVPAGDDVVLTNVLSFEVRPTWVPNTLVNNAALGANRRTVPAPLTATSDYPFDDLPALDNRQTVGNTLNQDAQFSTNAVTGGKRVFDTWSSSLTGFDSTTGSNEAVPFLARVTGVQIKIRIFDPKNNMTRQITMVQDL